MGFRLRRLTAKAEVYRRASREWHERRVAEHASMNDASLAATARYCLAQMTPADWAPGEPVYDATMWHVIVPELIRRLEAGDGS